jgi:hypothetical protein
MKPRCARHAATPSLRAAAKVLRRDRILDVGAASGGRLGMAYERHADIGGVSRLRMLNDFRARDVQQQEMESVFGPQKSTTGIRCGVMCASTISCSLSPRR